MDKFLNEELFEVVLEKAFIEHEKELLKSYPADDELESEYPISKKEIRRFKNIVKEKEYGKKLVRVYLERAAVIVLCMISLFFALIMTSPEVRAAVENVILKWYDKYTEFIFTESTTGLVAEKIEDVDCLYMPTNYELISDEIGEDTRNIFYTNKVNTDLYLLIEILRNHNATVSFDNEQLEYEKTIIGTNECWLMYNDMETYGGIVITNDSLTVKITGYVEKDDLIKIAENIK